MREDLDARGNELNYYLVACQSTVVIHMFLVI